MGFALLGATKLSAAADAISLSIQAKRFLKIELLLVASGVIDALLRFNSDSGNNYSLRLSADGAADSTSTSQSSVDQSGSQTTNMKVSIYIINKSDKEKPVLAFVTIANTPGAANAPSRRQVIGKWANTAAQITSVSLTNGQSGSFDVGSQMSIVGSD